MSEHKVARISVEVDGVEVIAEVAVVEKLECPALLGKDLGGDMTVKLLSLLDKAKGENVKSEIEVVTKQPVVSDVIRITRAQAKKDQLEALKDEVASAESGSSPLALADIFEFEDELFEEQVRTQPVAQSFK